MGTETESQFWEPCKGADCEQCAQVMAETSTGLRHDIVAGGSKFDDGKARMDLLDSEWIEGVAHVLRHGAGRYGAQNWRRGLKHSRTLGAALRHIFAYLRGEDNDKETGMSHVYHASCELMFACGMSSKPEMDDRYKEGK